MPSELGVTELVVGGIPETAGHELGVRPDHARRKLKEPRAGQRRLGRSLQDHLQRRTTQVLQRVGYKTTRAGVLAGQGQHGDLGL